MLEVRVESFLMVCKKRSYTKASEVLCITQPAVTQHVQSLEKQYGCKFFQYSNRELKLTKAGALFYEYAQNAKANEKLITQRLDEIDKERKTLRFAATLTIGEFTLAPILGDFLKTFSEYDITMYVENTETVLRMLSNGEISFALVEGLFNKSQYETRLYKMANFILTAPIDHPLLTEKSLCLEDVMDETIIVREKGSGSREVLESGLFYKNYTLESFESIIEIGNVNVIKEMVKSGIGISFMYEDAAREEIERGELVELKLSDFIIRREFNLMHLKSNIMQDEIDMFFNFLKNNTI